MEVSKKKGEIDEIGRDLKKNLNLQDKNHRYLTPEELDDDGYELLVDDRPRVPSPRLNISEYQQPPPEEDKDDDEDEDAALRESGYVSDLLKLRLKMKSNIASPG